MPSWTDRILYRSNEKFAEPSQTEASAGGGALNPEGEELDETLAAAASAAGIELKQYGSVDSIRTSDHKPVFARFTVRYSSLMSPKNAAAPKEGEKKAAMSPNPLAMPSSQIAIQKDGEYDEVRRVGCRRGYITEVSNRMHPCKLAHAPHFLSILLNRNLLQFI